MIQKRDLIRDMNLEEVKTCIGQLMRDLGGWELKYRSRMRWLLTLINRALLLDPIHKAKYESLIDIANIQMKYASDGRMFKDEYLYNYYSDEGLTPITREWLLNTLKMWEYNSTIMDFLKNQKL